MRFMERTGGLLQRRDIDEPELVRAGAVQEGIKLHPMEAVPAPHQAGHRKPVPAYVALPPSSSSIRRSWLYFARRSLRHGAPVLIWPVRRPTTRSAMKESSVSPERWETITPQPLRIDMVAASMASVIEPIWFTLRRSALHAPTSSALEMRFVFVTSRSSPTICTFAPMFFIRWA